MGGNTTNLGPLPGFSGIGPNVGPAAGTGNSSSGLGGIKFVDPNATQQAGSPLLSMGDPLPQYNNLYQYANQGAFTDPNQQGIYNQISNGYDRANQGAPQGKAYQMAGAQIAPQQMINGANINTSVSDQYQNGQSAYINMLNAQAQGQGPNLAGLQAQQTQQQNVLQQLGVAATQGGNPALAQRNAANMAANASQNVAQIAAQGQLQQQLSAQQQLGGALTSANSLAQQSALNQANMNQQAALSNQGAYNTAGLQQAGLTQNQMQANQQALNQMGMANMNSQTQQNQMNNSQYNAMLQAMMGQSQQGVNNNVAYQQMMQQSEQANMSLQAGQAIANQQAQLGVAGSAVQGGSALLGLMAAASDERLKKNIKSASMRGFLEALHA